MTRFGFVQYGPSDWSRTSGLLNPIAWRGLPYGHKARHTALQNNAKKLLFMRVCERLRSKSLKTSWYAILSKKRKNVRKSVRQVLESSAVSTTLPSLQYGSVLLCFVHSPKWKYFDFWEWVFIFRIRVKSITTKVSNKTPQKCQTLYLKTFESLLIICQNTRVGIWFWIIPFQMG